MKRVVQLLDTSIVDELLVVPGKSSGDGHIAAEFDALTQSGVEFRLPAAAVVQVGAHIGWVSDGNLRRKAAERYGKLIRLTLDRVAPWSFSPLLWDDKLLRGLLKPTHAAVLDLTESLARQHLEIGDFLIIGEFEQLRDNLDLNVVDVDVWTLDQRLRAVVAEIRST